jgi:Type III restriction enzyme, res subunit
MATVRRIYNQPVSTTNVKKVMNPQKREKSILLEVPFAYRMVASQAGAIYDSNLGCYRWSRGSLPPALESFRSKIYSYERFKEDDYNGTHPTPSPASKDIKLRPHQEVAFQTILKAKSVGRRGFLLADEVGLGKTLSTWKAILLMPDVKTVLIVAPLGVLAHWRQTISWLGDGGKRIIIINYDRLQKLFDITPDKSGKTAKKLTAKARTGVANTFDVIVWDESHRLKSPEAARTKFAVKLNAATNFILWLSATAGQDPLGISYLAPLLTQLTGDRVSDMKEFEKWCQSKGFGISRQKFGKWVWNGAPEDVARAERLLFGGPQPGGLRRRPQDISGWPEIQRIILPIDLDPEEEVLYAAAWNEFRSILGLDGRSKDSQKAMVARMRFRQKSSILRIDGTVDFAQELLDNNHQVAISVAFRETLFAISDKLQKAGYTCAQIYGGPTPDEKESSRMAFQRGDAKVVLFTPTEGISLHQGEHNDIPRSMIIHDLRWSAIEMAQVEGRCHRDGKFAQVYWAVAPNTIDMLMASTMISRMKSMKAMIGDGISDIDAIEKALSEL